MGHVQRRRGGSGAAGASLKQEGVTDVADAHRSGIRRQSQLVTGTAVAVNISTVPAVVLTGWHTSRVRCITVKQIQKKALMQTGKLTFLRDMENSFWHCLHCVASSSFSQAWPWTRVWHAMRKRSWLTYSYISPHCSKFPTDLKSSWNIIAVLPRIICTK